MTPSRSKSFPFSSTVKHGLLACTALSLSLAGCGGSGDSDPVVDNSPPIFTTFQSASVVIGQTDFTSAAANQAGATPDANTLYDPYGEILVSNDQLYIADSGNNRVLRFDNIPDVNDANASLVLGQGGDFTKTETFQLDVPMGLAMAPDGRLFVGDYGHHRVLIWSSPDSTADPVALAAGDGIACNDSALGGPSAVEVAGDKLIVADANQQRILVWSPLPSTGTEPATLVLGQGSMGDCDTSSETGAPFAVWSDGSRLVVGDTSHDRVLIWNTFPVSDSQPPDIILSRANGQADGSEKMKPFGVYFTGAQLLVSDQPGNRVLIWNGFPTENDQLPNGVLGQSDLSHIAPNDDDQINGADAQPSARTLNLPTQLFVHKKQLFVSDDENNRVLIFTAP